ncbi:MAG: dTDP-glucose 4,6-dehydratase [Candidatus Entotheonella gemina]|uniref:dTDP-glucose 4,6-dehydratase n=1 Tax=Candidatus Entotheonella gemina TaxID=1429439 RepID=W4MC79_9BACT|nr:MAG: dTDP-glucose 4,6-dehydratase [Candidatus Entotheonella gemina]
MHTYNPRNVLITGGAGFIGCHFVRHLLRTDRHVRIVNLDLLTYAGSLDNLNDLPDPERHQVVQGTICDRPLVDRLLREHDIDTIIHFAAESHVDRSITGPAAFIETNVIGTFTLLEAARDFWLRQQAWDTGQCRFHHVSTDEVYGTLDTDEPAFCETTPYAPNSPYAASKAASDHFVRAYHSTYGLSTVTTHCSNNYGPYQHHEKLIPTVIRSCLQNQPIPVYGDGSNMRDWLYVEDHCVAIDLVLRRGRTGDTYNIGGDNCWNNLGVVHLICEVLAELTGHSASGFTRLIHFVTDRPGHDWRYAVDTTKLRNELGWSPTETFKTGIRKTAAWYLTQYT